MIVLHKTEKDIIYLEKGYLIDYVKSYFLDTPYKQFFSKVEIIDSFTTKDDFTLSISLKKTPSLDCQIVFAMHKEVIYLLKSIFNIEKVKVAILVE